MYSSEIDAVHPAAKQPGEDSWQERMGRGEISVSGVPGALAEMKFFTSPSSVLKWLVPPYFGGLVCPPAGKVTS